MGFFKGLGKALGKIGKVALKVGVIGANAASGGLLDKAHSVAKTLGLTGAQRKQARVMRIADQALGTKLVPRVANTVVVEDQQSPMGVRKRTPVPITRRRVSAMPGSGEIVRSGASQGVRRKRRRPPVGSDAWGEAKFGTDMMGNPLPGRKAAAARKRSARRSGGATKRSRGTGAKRTLPPAMRARADRMRQMAQDWRAAGKPGRWIDWVKQNG